MKLLHYIRISYPLFYKAMFMALVLEAIPLAVSLLVLISAGIQPGGPVFIVLHLPGSLLALPVGWWITDLPRTVGNLVYGVSTILAQIALFSTVAYVILRRQQRGKRSIW